MHPPFFSSDVSICCESPVVVMLVVIVYFGHSTPRTVSAGNPLFIPVVKSGPSRIPITVNVIAMDATAVQGMECLT